MADDPRTSKQPVTNQREADQRGRSELDCYWVGSLHFNFLGNEGVFH